MDTSSDVIRLQPVLDSSTVPVTTVVAADEMSWGTFRHVQSLLCGVFRVPSFALQYDKDKSGSIVIKCVTSMEIAAHIQSTLLDDSDMDLLHHEKIVSIQIGKEYVFVGNKDNWMVYSTDKQEQSITHPLPHTEEVFTDSPRAPSEDEPVDCAKDGVRRSKVQDQAPSFIAKMLIWFSIVKNMDQGLQVRILARCHTKIRVSLNIDAIFPHLKQHALLTSNESDILLNDRHTVQYKIDHLVEWLPRKGRDALSRFIVCLRRSGDDALGHEELADLLEQASRNASSLRIDNDVGYANVLRPFFLTYGSLLALVLSLILCLHTYIHLQHNLWWTHSSLPEHGINLVGRENEIQDLIKRLDLQSDEVRIVGIVGPSGIGKSSLAAQVGNKMMDTGAVVSYVDLSLVFLDNLPHQLLQNAGISKQENSSQRLLQWLSHIMKQPLVIILDNCDSILATDRTRFYNFLDVMFSSAATTLKIIVTSRNIVKPTHHSEHFINYPIGGINPDASCQLLSTGSKRELNITTCGSITKLIGNVPLALELVGTILESQTADISKVIAALEKDVGSESTSSVEKQINVSISVSLKNLKKRLINLGQYLSLFPASFSMADACSVLSEFITEDCSNWIDRLRQRALLHYTGGGRYQLRGIVRQYFSKINDGKEVDENLFWRGYLRHFSAVLHEMYLKYHKNTKNAVELLEVEKQDVCYFLRHAHGCCEEFPNLYIRILQTLNLSDYLRTIYSKEEMIDLLRSSFMCLQLIVDKTITSTLGSNLEIGTDEAVSLYVHLTLKIVDLKSDDTELVFEQARVWLDKHINSTNFSIVKTFYLKLCDHYSSVGKLQEELFCHMKILKRESELSNCGPSNCSHKDISEVYFSLGRFDLSAHFRRLHIEQSNLSTLQQAEALLKLYTCYIEVESSSKARDTAKMLLALSPQLLNIGSLAIHNLSLYTNVTNMFRLHNWTEEAKRLEQKLVATIKEASPTDLKVEVFSGTIYSLVRSLFKAKEYGIVAEVAECALEVYKKEDDNITYSNEVAALHLLVGKAELYNHRRWASLTSLRNLVEFYYLNPALIHYARDACKVMLIQTHIEMACFYIAFQETMIVFQSVCHFVISDTFDVQKLSYVEEFEFPDPVPQGILIADEIANAPLGAFYIVFFIKWCITNVLYIFSGRFVVQIVNLVFIPVKFTIVISVLISPFFLLYLCGHYSKHFYRYWFLWNYTWSDDAW